MYYIANENGEFLFKIVKSTKEDKYLFVDVSKYNVSISIMAFKDYSKALELVSKSSRLTIQTDLKTCLKAV